MLAELRPGEGLGPPKPTAKTRSSSRLGDAQVQEDRMTVVSRRTMLTGAAATTAVTAVGSIDATRPAKAATSMDLFLGLSSALTGIAVDRLNPKRPPSQQTPRDVLDVKQAYYERAQRYPEFEQLLKL